MFIPDPNCLLPGSWIRIKEFKYFNPKKTKKWFLSSDPGCSSPIADPDADFLPIPDPGVIKAPDPGSGSATLQKSCRKFAESYQNVFKHNTDNNCFAKVHVCANPNSKDKGKMKL
jgi:hypothetical protein